MSELELTPNRLRTFVSVAEHESFTAAAAEVHLTQSAVSRQIAALESNLGVALLDRMGKTVGLTDAGRALLPECRRIVGDLARIAEAVRSVKAGEVGRLRIGASATPGYYVIPRLLARFHQQRPDVELEYIIGNTREVEDKLVANDVDLGFVGGTVVDPTLVTEPIAEDEVVCFVSRRHPLASRRRIAPADLSKETFILREEGSATRRLFTGGFLAAGGRIEKWIEIGCPEAVKSLVAAGLGVGCLSKFGLRDELSQSKIVALRISMPRVRRPLAVLRHARKAESPLLRSFLELVRREAKVLVAKKRTANADRVR